MIYSMKSTNGLVVQVPQQFLRASFSNEYAEIKNEGKDEGTK